MDSVLRSVMWLTQLVTVGLYFLVGIWLGYTLYWFNDYIKVYKLAVFLVLEMELQLAMSMEQEREQDLTTLVFQVYLGVHQILAPWE